MTFDAAAAGYAFTLAPEVFQRFLDERLPASSQPAAPLADLFLACACLQGVRGALDLLDAKLMVECRRIEARHRGEVVAADLQQELATRLLTGEKPRLAEYRGQGPLGAWLAAAGLRLALNARREGGRREARERVTVDAHTPLADPELELLRARSRDTFNLVFKEALSALEPRERALLRLHLVERLGIDRIAQLQNIGRSTAARWLADIRSKLLRQTRERLAEKLALGHSTLDALLPLLQADVEVSIRALLTPAVEQP